MRCSAVIITFLSLLLISCEDVVDVDLPPSDERLILDGLLRYNEDSPQENRIVVSTTGSFFGEIQPDTLMRIQTQDLENGGVGFYTFDPDRFGTYVPGNDEGGPFADTTFVTGPGNPESLIFLSFFYQNEIYGAFTSYTPVVPLDSLAQGESILLDENETEIIATFTDPEEEENFYVFGYGNGEFTAFDDRFFNGQEYTFSYFTSQQLAPGDELTVSMWGVDEELYNYMLKLIEQSALGEDTLFQVPAATVRGNIIKLEDIDNIDLFDNVGRPQEFVLGYFAYIQERTKTLEIQ